MKVKYGRVKTVYHGVIFDIEQQPVKENSKKKVFEYCVRPDSVTILPFDNKGRLLLINEYRHGFRHNTWFLPAGRVDKGETPARAAQRELQEEAGVKAGQLKLLYKKSPSNTLRWNIFIYAARGLKKSVLVGDEGFPIKVAPVSLKKATRMALSGEIENEFIAYNIIRFYYMVKHGQFKW